MRRSEARCGRLRALKLSSSGQLPLRSRPVVASVWSVDKEEAIDKNVETGRKVRIECKDEVGRCLSWRATRKEQSEHVAS